MLGLMQDWPLLCHRIIDHAAKYHGERKVLTRSVEGPIHTTNYTEMRARALTKNYPYPYLKDGDSAVAHAYGARVTPHVYLIDGSGTLRYRGYVDDSAKPEERKTTGLSNALDDLLGGKAVSNQTTHAFGCTIKWKKAT